MAMPSSKPGFPEEKSIRHFRNALLQLKKTIQSSTDVDELKMNMEHFIHVTRKVAWPHQTNEIFRKDEAEKALDKVLTEFQRYIKGLQHQKAKESPQDLLDALLIVETMIDQLKERH